MAYAFNQLPSANSQPSSTPQFDIPAEYAGELPLDMVEAAYNDLYPLSGGEMEEGTMGYRDNGGYSSIQMQPVARGEIDFSGPGKDLAYFTHTHGDAPFWYSNYFSSNDTSIAENHAPIFMANPRGEFRVYTSSMPKNTTVPGGRLRGPCVSTSSRTLLL